MKRLALLVALILMVLSMPKSVAAACAPNFQSCDTSTPCCNSEFRCTGGYCKPAPIPTQQQAPPTPTSLPCTQNYNSCDSNSICCNAPQFQCRSGYCQPTTPTPSCGSTIGQDCCSGNVCVNSSLTCIGGKCIVDPNACGEHGKSCCTSGTPCFRSGDVCTNTICQSPAFPTGTTGTGFDPGKSINIFCGDPKDNKINTAIGCISADPVNFIKTLLNFAIGIAGGIAFLLILFGGFQILTSAGNPEQLNAGKELVGSAIAGLLLIIFSIFLLRLIGVNILGLPGFG